MMKRPTNVVASPGGVGRQNLHGKTERSKVSLDFTDEPINREVVGGYFIF